MPLAAVFTDQLVEREGISLLDDVELPSSPCSRTWSASASPPIASTSPCWSRSTVPRNGTRRPPHTRWPAETSIWVPSWLQEILFAERGLPKTKKIKTGYTTDAEALTAPYAQTEDPLLAELLRYRDVSKLRQTVAGLLPLIDDSGRYPYNVQPDGGCTGRLSSTDLNLGTSPSERRRDARSAPASSSAMDSRPLLTADYSQIEMRIMAHLSADAGLIEAFNSGEDHHTTVGSRGSGCRRRGHRRDAPTHQRPCPLRPRLWTVLLRTRPTVGYHRGEAQSLMDEYFREFGGFGITWARSSSGPVPPDGPRPCWVVAATARSEQRQQAAPPDGRTHGSERAHSGSAADLVKVAMLRVDRALSTADLSRMLLQVHDELVLEVAPGELAQVESLVRAEMAQAYALDVPPLDVSVGTGVPGPRLGTDAVAQRPPQ